MRSMHPTFLLPYLIKEPEREKECSIEMERAAILCLSEEKRKKHGILSGSSETISCIAKICYPFWVVPWGDRCIIIDGLDLLSSSIRRNEIYDVLEFTEDLNRSSSSFSLFLKTLKRHSQTFQRFISSKEVSLKGIVNETSVLKSFKTIIKEAVKISMKDEVDAVFVPPIISGEQAEKRAQKFIEQWNILRSEIDALHYAIEVLNRETIRHKEKISTEIDEARRNYDLRISRTKKLVSRKVRTLVREKEKAKSKIKDAGKRRLEKMLKEEDRLKQKIESLNTLLREAVETRKRQKSRYPKRSTTRIDNRIAKYRSDIQILKGKKAKLRRMESEVRKETLEKLKEIGEKYQIRITEELEKLDILEEARKLEISEKSKIIDRIDQFSSAIESQIENLIEEKTKEIKSLEGKAIPAKIEETALIGIPFYLAIFESPMRTRAEIYPPMVAKSYTSTMQKIRRMLFSFSLESRMELLLNPRFPELNREIFINLEKKMRSNPIFKGMIFETAKSNNLIESSEFVDDITKGIDDLEKEGWIGRDEKRDIIEMYVRS